MEKVRDEIIKYVEENVFPLYKNNDNGHNLGHIKYVIERSMKFASMVPEINFDMVYVIAAYHDVGHSIDAKNHEKVSSEMLLKDEKLKEFFSDCEISIMADAVYDHRASLSYEPRTIYGKIVSTADRNTLIEDPFKRTYTYRLYNSPQYTLDEIIDEALEHLKNKFGKNGYASEKTYFEDDDYKVFLNTLQDITSDYDKFRSMFIKINGIDDVYSNMLFVFDEIMKKNGYLSLDKIIYYVYIKLNTDLPFYEVKRLILEERGIDEYFYYIKDVNKDLVDYVVNNIFPKYEANDKAHGIIHIKEVIRRCFALNATFDLGLDPNMLFAIGACHDVNKYIDSDIHEKLAAKAFRDDINFKRFFSDSEIQTIADAIEDHRSSLEDEPRSIYGKLISSADRNTTIEMVFIRSFFVALGNGKNNRRDSTIEDYLEYTHKRLSKRYSEENPENMFFEDDTYRMFFRDMKRLLKNPDKFKEYYCEVNGIDDRSKLVSYYDGVKEKRKD